MVVVSTIAALGVSVAGAFGVTLAAGSLTAFAVGLGTQIALGAALRALTPKPQLPSTAPRGYTVNQRGAALDHQIIYGRAKVGGVIVFTGTTGTNNKFLHQVVAYTGHEIEEFEDIYINDARVTGLDASGNVTEITLPDGSTSDRYDGFIRIKKHLGSPTQAADPDLVSEVPEWTNNHRLQEIAYLYVRYAFDADVFPNGVPQVTATIKGKKVYDPRTDTTAWSDNPALCIRDYLTSGYGLSEADANIDDTLVSAAANICDQANTDAGTTRYTCNGNFTTGAPPEEVIEDVLSSMGGLLWYAQGEWRMRPAYWAAPSLEFTEDDLRSSVQVRTRHSRRSNFNTIRGTFRGPETDWQLTDYPEVTNAAFLSADNGQESVADVELPFTDNSIEARRLARILLERNRQQITVSASFGLRAFQVQVGDVIQLTLSRFGWSQKTFEVVSWSFGLTDGLDLQVQMTLREISESVFDEVDDGIVYERDNTTLLSPFEVPAVGISLTAVARVIREKALNSLDVTVTSAASERIDHVEVEYKPSSSSDWIKFSTGQLGRYEILDLEPGNYDVRARAVNTFGIKGEYTVAVDFDVDAFAGAPADVTNFSFEVVDNTLNLSWDAVPDLDLSHYKLRYSTVFTGAAWSNATTAQEKVSRPGTNTSFPLRAGSYMIKSYDKGGVPSDGYTTLVVPTTYLPSYANTLTQTEDATFSGTKTGVSVVSGGLRLTAPVSAGTTGTYEFSTYIDTSASRIVWARIEANPARVDDSGGLFDDLPGLFDNLPGLFDSLGSNSQIDDTNVLFYIATTEDDPAGSPTWSDWKQFRAGNFYGRAFKFKIELKTTSDNITPNITSLDAIVEYD